MIRIALAAPSALLLAGLEALVLRDATLTVVERITGLAQVAESLEGADVDVVLAVVDPRDAPLLTLPTDGEGWRWRWIVLTDIDGADVGEWMRRGVQALLPRDADAREILATIDAVHAGLTVLPSSVASALLAPATRASRLTVAGLGGAPAAIAPLSPREREILALLAEGMGNKIVAARLGISEHTVKTHVASIFQKLGAETRAEAVAIGARSGLILL